MENIKTEDQVLELLIEKFKDLQFTYISYGSDRTRGYVCDCNSDHEIKINVVIDEFDVMDEASLKELNRDGEIQVIYYRDKSLPNYLNGEIIYMYTYKRPDLVAEWIDVIKIMNCI